MATPQSKLDAFCNELKEQRQIKIFIGSGEEEEGPFHVQESVLCAATDYFTKAINRGDSMGSEPGVLRFPDDPKPAMKILLWWLIRHHPPSLGKREERELLLVQCWILADKYLIKWFQDQVMYKLLLTLEKCTMTPDAIVAAFHGTAPKSGLRWLAAEEAVEAVHGKKTQPVSFLEELNGATEAASSIATAVQDSYSSMQYHDRGFGCTEKRLGQVYGWQQYMVLDHDLLGTCPYWF